MNRGLPGRPGVNDGFLQKGHLSGGPNSRETAATVQIDGIPGLPISAGSTFQVGHGNGIFAKDRFQPGVVVTSGAGGRAACLLV